MELIPYSAVSLQVTACIVINPVVICHHLPPGPQRHTCIVMNPVVGCHHLPPGPQRHTCIVMNLAVGSGFHYFLPGLQLLFQPSGVTVPIPVPTYTAWRDLSISISILIDRSNMCYNVVAACEEQCVKQFRNPFRRWSCRIRIQHKLSCMPPGNGQLMAIFPLSSSHIELLFCEHFLLLHLS